MFRCKCCGYECDCMDLYYDHIMFDRRHQEMAQRESAETSSGAPQTRRSRHDLRGKRSSLLYSRRQHYASPLLRASPTTTTPHPPDSASAAQSADSSPLVAPKQALVLGSAGY
ncbi:hypothetical protein GGI11_005713 [Coemansia sp. RSA 2049]|nr:hypothetical protein GGI11_005713 [Coemansia sp. RSA 2049]KAJ2519881.1 hypothetical protein H4217_002401 [Coemansia sp. RSA 1939]KAJ2592811.1 hypothetical protein EV177_008663 [Coemansia sp. RSA 1804]